LGAGLAAFLGVLQQAMAILPLAHCNMTLEFAEAEALQNLWGRLATCGRF
jgi:hypothetical protein